MACTKRRKTSFRWSRSFVKGDGYIRQHFANAPQGLDGHHFTFTFYENEKEYDCWCVIPKEWEHIEPVVDLFVSIAGLDESYKVTGVM